MPPVYDKRVIDPTKELMLLDKQKRMIEHRQRQLLVQTKSTHGQVNPKPINKPKKAIKYLQKPFPIFKAAQKFVIERSLKEIIARVVPVPDRQQPFYSLLHSQLRMKMALALTDCGVYNYYTVTTDQVLSKYRYKNPCKKDEEFVLEVWKLAKQAYWPVITKVNGRCMTIYPSDDDGVQATVAQSADGINNAEETAEGSHSQPVHNDSLDYVKQDDDNGKSNDVEQDDWTEGNSDWN